MTITLDTRKQMKVHQKEKWGFLRETSEKAQKAGADPDTGLHRTGLEEYLKVIFPEISKDEWIHDKVVPGSKSQSRPDYRCESLKLIVEFDGLQHYQKPNVIRADEKKDKMYEEMGYKIVRIPYFIQLTNEVIKLMFDKDVEEIMFNPEIPSMGVKGQNTPAFCCPAGIKRMAREFKFYLQQYEVNIHALEKEDDYLSGFQMLKDEYNRI